MSKLAFVIPYHNKPTDVLSRCLRSIKTQALKDWEVILVKDGPSHIPDRVIENVFDHSDRVKVIEIEHGGACAARNAGFAEANSTYVVFWDADCIIEPEVAKQWVDFLDKHPEYGFVYSGYRFLGDGAGAIHSEPFDPWTLRIRNYISACFPVRAHLVQKWDTDLQSLQDWDFWLSVVETGAKGKFIEGYAFSTPLPDKDSISGRGCTNEAWLGRVDAVKKKHKLPERHACVAAPVSREDGILLAKSIDADYQDFPEFKPHKYDTIVKIGFAMDAGRAGYEAATLKNRAVNSKYLFWTPEDIATVYNRVNIRGLQIYSMLLNSVCKAQFVECKSSYDLMKKAGFNVEIMPLPMRSVVDHPFPKEPCWLIDVGPEFGGLAEAITQSLPDIKTVTLRSGAQIEEFTGMLHLYQDGLLSSSIKRMLISGRHVVSNVKSEFCGYINDDKPDLMLKAAVNTIRNKSFEPMNHEARTFWREKLDPIKFKEKIDEPACQLCHS